MALKMRRRSRKPSGRLTRPRPTHRKGIRGRKTEAEQTRTGKRKTQRKPRYRKNVGGRVKSQRGARKIKGGKTASRRRKKIARKTAGAIAKQITRKPKKTTKKASIGRKLQRARRRLRK